MKSLSSAVNFCLAVCSVLCKINTRGDGEISRGSEKYWQLLSWIKQWISSQGPNVKSEREPSVVVLSISTWQVLMHPAYYNLKSHWHSTGMFTSILFPNQRIYTDTVRPGRGIMHHSGSPEHILNGVFETLYSHTHRLHSARNTRYVWIKFTTDTDFHGFHWIKELLPRRLSTKFFVTFPRPQGSRSRWCVV